MLNSVHIGDKDLTEFGCILAHVEISAPSVQTKLIDVPLRNGAIDFTEVLTGDVKYENRKIKIVLKLLDGSVMKVQSDIANFLHGRRYNIVFDEDASYFYNGRLEVKSYTVAKSGGGKITLEADCDPFKYAVVSSAEDWLWDSFDFEEGYINDLKDIHVDGSTTVTLIGDSANVYATAVTDSPMALTYDGVTVNIPVGSTKLYDFELKQGENAITITGNGIISIDYRGGRL